MWASENVHCDGGLWRREGPRRLWRSDRLRQESGVAALYPQGAALEQQQQRQPRRKRPDRRIPPRSWNTWRLQRHHGGGRRGRTLRQEQGPPGVGRLHPALRPRRAPPLESGVACRRAGLGKRTSSGPSGGTSGTVPTRLHSLECAGRALLRHSRLPLRCKAWPWRRAAAHRDFREAPPSGFAVLQCERTGLQEVLSPWTFLEVLLRVCVGHTWSRSLVDEERPA